MTKISIVIPVYKAEPYIEDCVQSILQQTFKDFELLLVDDGSPDKSGELCDSLALKDPRIRVFHKPNGGATSARKYGVEHAKGEWIMFSDADDEIPTYAIEDLIKHISNDIDFVAGTIYYQSLNLLIKTESDKESLSPEDYICCLLDRKTYYGPCSKLIKRKLFAGIDWLCNKKVFQNEDLLMLIQLASNQCGRIAIANEERHYICITREDSASSQVMPYYGWKILFEKIESTLCSHKLFSSKVKQAYTNYTLWALMNFCVVKRLPIPFDTTIKRIMRYAKEVKIESYNESAYKCLKSPFNVFVAVQLRRLKDLIFCF